MNNYISREDAVAEFGRYLMDMALMDNPYASNDLWDWKQLAENVLDSVPSETDVLKIIRCMDCEFWNKERAQNGCASCERDALIRNEWFFCADGKKVME